jgi:molybdate transport system substrate-binding protein
VASSHNVTTMYLMRRLMVLGIVALAAGCGGGSDTDATTPSECASVTVFAASSFAPIVDDAADECLGEANVSLASSTVLAAQIADGAPVDVFVSAGLDAVRSLQSQGITTGEPRTIGFNSAAVMVSTVPGVADSIESVDDLKNRKAILGACVESAPCGKLFDDVMSRVTGSPLVGNDSARKTLVDTEVLNAAELVSKISLGEVDAGIVYASDCAEGTRPAMVRCVDIPVLTDDGKPLNSRVPYVVITLTSSKASDVMFRYLTSTDFLSRLRSRFGLEAP